MTSRTKTTSLDPLREWTDPSGEQWGSLHPLYQAIAERYGYTAAHADWGRLIVRRINEFADGRRKFPDDLAERVLELDAMQQANGAPDENLTGLVALLRGRGA